MVEEYASHWKDHGKYLCISDHGMMAAIPRQIKACENTNLSPLFGVELYVNPLQIEYNTNEELQKYIKSLDPNDQKLMRKKGYHLLAIAENEIGYSNLVHLTSLAWTKGFYYRPRVNHEQLMKYKEGIIFTSCCYASEIAQAYENGGEEAGFSMIEKYRGMFGDNFYLEIMLLDFDKQKPYDIFILKAHDKYKIPVILTNDCFVEGTLVLTKEGYKNIEDVSVGDQVLTHENRYKKVEVCGSRYAVANEVKRIKTRMGTYAFDATYNHKLYTAKKSGGNWNFSWKKVKDISTHDFLLIPKISQNDVFSDKDLDYIDLFDFINESQYQKDDCCNSSNKGNLGCKLMYLEETNEFVFYSGLDRGCETRIPRFLELNDEFLKILGWYIAKGWSEIDSNQVVFAFHKSETIIANWIVNFFDKYGVSEIIYEVSENGIVVRFSSKVFSLLFGKLCGSGAKNKHLPYVDNSNFFGKFSKKQMSFILDCYQKGDGYTKDKFCGFYSTSKVLIYEIATVFNSLGICCMPSIRDNSKKNWSDLYYLEFSARKSSFIKNWFLEPSIKFSDSRPRGTKYFYVGNHWAVQIVSIDPIFYNGLVYDFQVEDDHSFVANLYISSNCHYCKAEDSKYQRLMLMIQTQNTVQDIERKLKEEGMQDLFELQDTNLWMKTEDDLNAKWLSDYKDIVDYDLFKAAKRNTVEICRKAEGVKLDRSIKLPMLPDSNEKLADEVIKGYKWRCLPKDAIYGNRIKEELELIKHKDFASYFLITKMATDEARRVCRDVIGWGSGVEAVGPGRGCLGHDTPIVLSNGKTKTIKDISVGDQVITIDGSIRQVTNTFVYDCQEPLLNFKCYYGDNDKGVSLTPDHKVYAEKQRRPKNYENWSESTKRSRKSFLDPVGDLNWLQSKDLEVGDWVFVPEPVSESNLNLIIDLAKYTNEKNLRFDDEFVYQDWFNPITGKIRETKKIKRYLELDNQWLMIFGIFAGDGWLQKNKKPCVAFCSHSQDVYCKAILKHKFEDLGAKVISKKHKKKKLLQFYVNNKILHNMFQDLFCDYKCSSCTKHIPEIVIKSDNLSLKEAFLKGYFFADGHQASYKIKFSTVSQDLLSQVRYLCWQLGIPASKCVTDRLDKRNGRQWQELSCNIPKNQFLGNASFEKQYNWRKVPGGILTRIRSIEEIYPEDGKVYDIEVKNNHNYLTSSFLVHNSAVGSLVCYCLGITDVDPIKHDLLFSRFLSPARGGRSMNIRFSGDPISN